jgi:hypothetical protein
MSADPKQQHDTPDRGQGHADQHQPTTHPFDQALATWQAWSMANTMRLARQKAHDRGDQVAVASFQQHPEWTQGPSPLAALRANHEAVQSLTGWRWHAIREAREQGHSWAEIGQALGLDPAQARRGYLERVERQRRLAAADPELGRLLGYQPLLAELAQPNQADRAAHRAPPEPGPEDRHER